MKTVPTPPVIDTTPRYEMAKPYPLRYTASMAMHDIADDWNNLPWWRRVIARWASGRDWGVAMRGFAKIVATEDDRHQAVMVDREELVARYDVRGFEIDGPEEDP